jgi:hypothetical protein
MSDPRMSEPRMSEPRMSDPRMSDPRMSEPRMSDPKRLGAAWIESRAPATTCHAPGPTCHALALDKSHISGREMVLGRDMSVVARDMSRPRGGQA